jgi:hypothetical protein
MMNPSGRVRQDDDDTIRAERDGLRLPSREDDVEGIEQEKKKKKKEELASNRKKTREREKNEERAEKGEK